MLGRFYQRGQKCQEKDSESLTITAQNPAFALQTRTNLFQEGILVFLGKIPSPPKFNANTYKDSVQSD
jgi:hypothetical protein